MRLIVTNPPSLPLHPVTFSAAHGNPPARHGYSEYGCSEYGCWGRYGYPTVYDISAQPGQFTISGDSTNTFMINKNQILDSCKTTVYFLEVSKNFIDVRISDVICPPWHATVSAHAATADAAPTAKYSTGNETLVSDMFQLQSQHTHCWLYA